ncbi:MAG TPA: CsbD family protein [Beijerinckiaceae bacterium]|nr:CsbD family protein [Beijerinckiaceae bacterium]
MDRQRIEGEAKRQFGRAQEAVGEFAGDARTQAQGMARQAEGAVENYAGQARDAVREYAGEAAAYAGEAYERGRRTVRRQWDRYEPDRYLREGRQVVRRQVETHPLVSILIAGAVGYLLAYLIHAPRGGSGDGVPDYARRESRYRWRD